MKIALLIMEKSWNFVFEFLWEPCKLANGFFQDKSIGRIKVKSRKWDCLCTDGAFYIHPNKGTCSYMGTIGVTIVAKNYYCDSIDIAGSTIAILLLLWTTIAILL